MSGTRRSTCANRQLYLRPVARPFWHSSWLHAFFAVRLNSLRRETECSIVEQQPRLETCLNCPQMLESVRLIGETKVAVPGALFGEFCVYGHGLGEWHHRVTQSLQQQDRAGRRDHLPVQGSRSMRVRAFWQQSRQDLVKGARLASARAQRIPQPAGIPMVARRQGQPNANFTIF